MTSNMEKEKSGGQMELFIKANIILGKKMDMVNLIGLTSQATLEILKIIIYMEKECINGMTAENFLEIGF